MAALALALFILAPQGFMVSASPAGGAQLVVCSGHGDMAVKAQHGKADTTAKQTVCAFAGHGLGDTAAAPTHRIASANITHHVAPTAPLKRPSALALAAPPPPSQAPPAST